MDIVVKLPDKNYSVILTKIMLACRGCEIIELPKGHGRIGDLDTLRKEVSSWGMNDYEPSDFVDAIDQAGTIIEADRSEEE